MLLAGLSAAVAVAVAASAEWGAWNGCCFSRLAAVGCYPSGSLSLGGVSVALSHSPSAELDFPPSETTDVSEVSAELDLSPYGELEPACADVGLSSDDPA